MSSIENHVDTLVIGAGIAGIAAARTLREAQRSYLVLEARERIGGRTHTEHALGAPVDLGAAWIHGPSANPLHHWAREFGITMSRMDLIDHEASELQAYDGDGTPLDMAEYSYGQQLAQGGFAHAAASTLYPPPGADIVSMADWLAYGLPVEPMSETARKGFFYWSVMRMQYGDAADLNEMDWRLGQGYVKLPGRDILPHGTGYNGITDRLAAGLNIRTGVAVDYIQYDDNGVVARSNAGTFTAKHLIVTVPLSLLQAGQINFSPSLPPAKQGAIQRIGYGHYEKLALRFDRFYWPRDKNRFNYLPDEENPLFTGWLNLGHFTGVPIIIVYHSGSRALRTNEWADETMIRKSLAVMQQLFGAEFGAIPWPEAYLRTEWAADPWARGSYSFDRVGQQPGDRAALAAPVGQRLFFAGEATHPHYYATVHGAYESGIRAAQEILTSQEGSG